MYSLNRAEIIGNITRDPEMRYIPSGQGVTSFGVATNRRWKNQAGELQEDTQFHEIVAWGKLAELCSQILHKGNKVYVEGRLQTRSWEAPDGSKRQRTEIVMDNFVPLTPKGAVSPMAEEENPPAGGEEKPAPKPKEKEEAVSKPDKKTKKEEKEEKVEEIDEDINLEDIPF